MKRLAFLTVLSVIIAACLLLTLAQDKSAPTGSKPSRGLTEARTANAAAPQVLSLAHTISTVSVQPGVIPVSSSTSVTFSTIISDTALIGDSVNLIRVTPTQSTILGQMQSKGQGLYSLTVPITLASPSIAQFEVSAAFIGSLKRTISTPVVVAALEIPPGFTVDQKSLEIGGPLSMDNFGSAYQAGGIIPPSGAAIDATVMTPGPPPPLSDYIASVELQGATVTSQQPIEVSNISCTSVVYTDSFSPSLNYSNEAVYCPFGKQLYKFFLSFNTGDQNASAYTTAFNQVISSAVLTP